MWIFSIVLATFVAFMQSTIIPALSVSGGQIELQIIIILLFLFFGRLREACIFLLVCSTFSALFSGAPIIYLVLPDFLIISIYVFLDRRRIFFRPGTLLAFPIIFLAVALADFFKLIMLSKLGAGIVSVLLANSIYSAIVGMIIFYFINKIYHLLNPHIMRERIKLAR
jgi:hypothetical protein